MYLELLTVTYICGGANFDDEVTFQEDNTRYATSQDLQWNNGIVMFHELVQYLDLKSIKNLLDNCKLRGQSITSKARL